MALTLETEGDESRRLLDQLSEKVETVHRLIQQKFGQDHSFHTRMQIRTSSSNNNNVEPQHRERPSVVDLRIGSLREPQARQRTRNDQQHRRNRPLPTPRAELQARPSSASIAAGLSRRRRRRNALASSEAGNGSGNRNGVGLTDAYLDGLVHRHSASIQQRYLEQHYFFATTQNWVRGGSASMSYYADLECVLGPRMGMRQSEIAALASFTVANEQALDSCCICIDAICSGEEAITLPCSHTFHQQCISRWLTRRRECPLCKHHIETHSAQTETETSDTQ